MSLSYRKFTAEEDKLRNLLDDGEYIAHIDNVVPTKSKGGLDKNGQEKPILPMLQLDLTVIDNNNRERKLKDWVILEGDMAWKFRHLAASCGLIEKYEDQTLHLRDLFHKRCVIKLTSKDGTTQEGEIVRRNNVADYISSKEPMHKKSNDELTIDNIGQPKEEFDTDIPF